MLNLNYKTIDEISKYKEKKILVVGLGRQGGGLGVAKFWAKHGSKVRVTDLKTSSELVESIRDLEGFDIEYSLGGHKIDDFLWADVIFKGPAVSWNLPEIIQAKKKGKVVTTELGFFMKNCRAKVIGITGTRGKSTTTMMIYDLIKEFLGNVYLGGNIPGKSTISLLDYNLTENSWVVLELSSWQLSDFHNYKVSPNISVFTNFYPDHLNFYHSMEDYFYDKSAIYLYQKKGDWLVANKILQTIIRRRKNVIWFNKDDFNVPLTFLKGDHNRENAAAALSVAKIMGINYDVAIKFISKFRGIPFRQQVLTKWNGILIVNDSCSTTPVATETAIRSFKDNPIVLIIGGNDKNLPFENLKKELSKVKKILFLKGTFTQIIMPYIQKDYPTRVVLPVFDNLEKAFSQALEEAKKIKKIFKSDPVILFSPGATSFSMFKNEFDRGEKFNLAVKKKLGITNLHEIKG